MEGKGLKMYRFANDDRYGSLFVFPYKPQNYMLYSVLPKKCCFMFGKIVGHLMFRLLCYSTSVFDVLSLSAVTVSCVSRKFIPKFLVSSKPVQAVMLLTKKQEKKSGLESASELYRQSDRRLSVVKIVTL
jgi:hypothetical protein